MVSRFLFFLVNDVFFPRPSFFKPPRGSKGGPGTIFGHFYDPPGAQNGPFEGPFSVRSTPRNNLNLISVEFQGNLFAGLYFLLKSLFPGLAECAERLNPPPPPGCRACQIRIGIRQFQTQMPAAHSARPSGISFQNPPKVNFLRVHFSVHFSNESKSPPGAPWGCPWPPPFGREC